MDNYGKTRLNPEDRQARLARIRAARGTPERELKIAEMQAAQAKAARDAAAADAADRAFTRAFNRADLRTQTLMLADTAVKDFGPSGEMIADLLGQLASSLPAAF